MAILGRRQPFRIKISGALFSGIQFDASSNSTFKTASSSYNWNHTWQGVNRFLDVSISMLSAAGTTVTNITYGGGNMTFVGAISSITGSDRVEVWRMTGADSGAPAAGSNSIVVSLSAPLNSVGTAVSLVGVHQTLPIEGFVTAQQTNGVTPFPISINVVSIADQCWLLAALATTDSAPTIAGGATQLQSVTGGSGTGALSDQGPITPAGTTLMSWSTAALTTSSMAGMAIRPYTASGPVSFDPSLGFPMWTSEPDYEIIKEGYQVVAY